jgi:hypothetical protein
MCEVNLGQVLNCDQLGRQMARELVVFCIKYLKLRLFSGNFERLYSVEAVV